MEITSRGLWTLIHGMGFGALFLLAGSGALVQLYRRSASAVVDSAASHDDLFLRIYLVVMAALAWFAVLTGTYIIYPWYRAVPPAGTTDLTAFPQRLLMASASTSGWHSLGMEWKEHVAWLAPICITMAAGVVLQYGRALKNHPSLQSAVRSFVWIALLAAAVAGFFGAMLNKNAPVTGGSNLHLMRGE